MATWEFTKEALIKSKTMVRYIFRSPRVPCVARCIEGCERKTLATTITASTPYANRLSLQANLKDYAWIAEIFWVERQSSLPEINARLADNLVTINGKLEFPREFVLKRLS